MTVIYLKDQVATHQVNQWYQYQQKLNPFFIILFALGCSLYAIAVIEFQFLTVLMGITAFVKMFCYLRIKELKKKMDQES